MWGDRTSSVEDVQSIGAPRTVQQSAQAHTCTCTSSFKRRDDHTLRSSRVFSTISTIDRVAPLGSLVPPEATVD